MNLFKSEEDRQLWIRLNAEHQIAWEKGLTYFDIATQTRKPTLQARNLRSMEEALEIAQRQCEYDERKGELRHTLEDYLLKSTEELNADSNKNHQKFVEQFKSLK